MRRVRESGGAGGDQGGKQIKGRSTGLADFNKKLPRSALKTGLFFKSRMKRSPEGCGNSFALKSKGI